MTIREIVQRSCQRGVQFLKLVRSKQTHEICFTPCTLTNAVSRTYQQHPAQSWTKKSVSFLNSAWKVCLQSCRETWIAHLRRQACLKFMAHDGNGRGVSLLAFVGVAMASNSGVGLMSNHDEMKAICEQIRMSMSVVPTAELIGEKHIAFDEGEKLESFEIGHVIAKGCNAVVYSAKLNQLTSTPIKGSQQLKEDTGEGRKKIEGNFFEYPLAVKMMFNYDAESYASVILRAMHRETLPAKKIMLPDSSSSFWELKQPKSCLASHPNIVDMKYVFADQIPILPEQLSLYPDALPTRLYPEGCGRNMTLFLVMKRYHKTLKEYLRICQPQSDVSLMLLAQILEGVCYLNKNGICHRDLKSDNILLDLSEGPNMPRVVITDFGCCTTRMSIPFPNAELDVREGNVAMMAPEVSAASPGPFTFVDYRKADLWATGVLAYEIYGVENPFYSSKMKTRKKLSSRVYKEEDLPSLPDDVSAVVKSLILNILSRHPSKRMSADIAADICHILLFAPKHWFVYSQEMPCIEAVTKWLVMEAASCASLPTNNPDLADTMKIVFLRRVKLDDMIKAVKYIRSTVFQ